MTLFFLEGYPIEHFYVEDGLHLTADAYDALSEYIQPLLTQQWLDWGKVPS